MKEIPIHGADSTCTNVYTKSETNPLHGTKYKDCLGQKAPLPRNSD
jgi:hypothetical protein